ncbi:hypothetical protein V5O48_007307 [Marasmius crinis-equi]|uniref:MARVEL domain-containing protein n=1 Tax=Marasmius crinis-equi TaxID=585013 RepID=A0ABR3FH21_9AGAR
MPNTLVSVIRCCILILATLLSLAIIAIGIHDAVVLIPIGDFPSWVKVFDFLFVGWIAGALTVILCPILLIMGLAWRNGPLTKNVVELPIFGVLLILWLVVGARSNRFIERFNDRLCELNRISFDGDDPVLKIYCNEFPAVRGLSFTNFTILLVYCLLTIALCIVAKARNSNRKVWLISASQAHYFGTPEPKPQPPMNNVVYAQYSGPYPYPPQGAVPPMMMMNGSVPGQNQMPYVVYVPQPMPMVAQPTAESAPRGSEPSKEVEKN